MDVKRKSNNGVGCFITVFIVAAVFINIITSIGMEAGEGFADIFGDSDSKYFRILASYDYKSLEDDIEKAAKKEKIKVKFEYMGDLDMVEELNKNSDDYDAVWISNSMWLYMLDNSYLTSNSKSLGVSPVVFGIRKSKAQELGLVDTTVTNTDILNLIRDKKISYVMNSVTQTNTGATAYLGFLTSLAGNPEILTEEILQNPELIQNLKAVFSGVERVSGEEAYLETMFLNNDNYEAVISSESSLIQINNSLKKEGKEQLYFIYPSDGVAINDSTFGFIDNKRDKEEDFLTIQNYLLSDEGQKLLVENGIRTWYGGTNSNPNKKVFNPDWGIKTDKYLKVTRFPSKSMITRALNLYIEELRKPTHVVFCLDYSGSMYGDGSVELIEAMDYILNYEEASKDKLQFSRNDKITVITFSNRVNHVYTATGQDTFNLRQNIANEYIGGSTALYDAIIRGIEILDQESDDYTKTIIAMTDGEVNVGTYSSFTYAYDRSISKVPVYSITFGDAVEEQLDNIARYTNSKVFDGKSGLLRAFKEVRSYN